MSKNTHINPYLVDQNFKGDANAYRLHQKQEAEDNTHALVIFMVVFFGILLTVWAVSAMQHNYQQAHQYDKILNESTR